MIRETGNWTDYRARFNLLPEDEIDLHHGRRDPHTSYFEVMSEVGEIACTAVRRAFEQGRPYIMFTHGASTSRPEKMHRALRLFQGR
jgi:hypothetical protein